MTEFFVLVTSYFARPKTEGLTVPTLQHRNLTDVLADPYSTAHAAWVYKTFRKFSVSSHDWS